MNKEEQMVINLMIDIYATYEYDWMGTKISKDNPLTYHHIIKRKKGETTINNGALLTKKSHEKLNKLYYNNAELFDLWQLLFLKINRENKPISEENKELIRQYRDMMSESLYQRKMKR